MCFIIWEVKELQKLRGTLPGKIHFSSIRLLQISGQKRTACTLPETEWQQLSLIIKFMPQAGPVEDLAVLVDHLRGILMVPHLQIRRACLLKVADRRPDLNRIILLILSYSL